MQPERRANELFLKIQHAANLLQRLPRPEPQQNDDTIADLEYARAPNPELRSFSNQGRMGGILNPNNVPDQVMADWLAEHNDPREHIVRQDLAMRGGAVGDYGMNWLDAINRVAGPDADSHTIGRERHDLGDGNYLYAVPYGTKFNDPSSTTGFELQWESPHSIYSGIFTPDEASNILTGLGVDSQHIRQQSEPEQEQFAADEPPIEYGDHPDEQAFHRLLHENRNDTTAALVYADWLEEHGQSAAAHIIRKHVEEKGTGAERIGMWNRAEPRFHIHGGDTGRGFWKIDISHPNQHDPGRFWGGLQWEATVSPEEGTALARDLFANGAQAYGGSFWQPDYMGRFGSYTFPENRIPYPEEGQEFPDLNDPGLHQNRPPYHDPNPPEQEQQPDEQLAAYEPPIDYAGNPRDLTNMFRTIHPRAWRGTPNADMTSRVVTADMLDELGRHREAAILRDTRRHAYLEGGEVHDAGDIYRESTRQAALGRGHATGLTPDERQYLGTALWSSGDSGSDTAAEIPLDLNYTVHDIHPNALASMIADWRHFKDTSGYNMDQSDDAHHFWLSRNGHGTGFFDAEDWSPEQRQELQQKAKQHGEYDLYVGDDGMIHGSYEVDPNLPSIDEQMNQPEQNAADPPMDYGPNRRIAGWIPPPHKKIYPASPRPSTEIRPGRGLQAQLYTDEESLAIPNQPDREALAQQLESSDDPDDHIEAAIQRVIANPDDTNHVTALHHKLHETGMAREFADQFTSGAGDWSRLIHRAAAERYPGGTDAGHTFGRRHEAAQANQFSDRAEHFAGRWFPYVERNLTDTDYEDYLKHIDMVDREAARYAYLAAMRHKEAANQHRELGEHDQADIHDQAAEAHLKSFAVRLGLAGPQQQQLPPAQQPEQKRLSIPSIRSIRARKQNPEQLARYDNQIDYVDYTDADFLNRIVENPHDELGAQAYADWLEENGRPHQAAIIRHHVKDYSERQKESRRLGESTLWEPGGHVGNVPQYGMEFRLSNDAPGPHLADRDYGHTPAVMLHWHLPNDPNKYVTWKAFGLPHNEARQLALGALKEGAYRVLSDRLNLLSDSDLEDTQQPDEQLARHDSQIDYAEASERDLRNLFRAVRENPYDETLHAALADALQELYPDSPIHDLIRQKFSIGPHTGKDRQKNLWYPEFENSWDGSFPYTARLGRHGPFNLYLGHEGSPELYQGVNQRWIVHAVSRFPETRDTGYTFEFPHEQAHLIPQMFPTAGDHIDPHRGTRRVYGSDEHGGMPVDFTEPAWRARESRNFEQRMDEEERNRGDDYAAYGADDEYDEDQYSPEEIERMKSSDQEWKRDRQHKQDQAESDRRNLEEMRKRRGNPPAGYDRVDYVDQQTVNYLLAQLASDEHNHTRWATPNQRDETQRLVTADALDEMGRDQEAQWLRDLDQHVMVQDGKVWPAHFHYNDVRNAFRDLHNTAATLTNGLVSPADEMALVPSGNPMSYMWRRWVGLEPEDFAEPPEEPGHGEVSVVHFGPENVEYGPVNVNVHHSKLGNHLADEVSREMEPYVDWENVPADDMAELDEAEKRLRTAPYEALDISKMPGPRQQEPDEQLARYAGNPYDEDYLASIPWDRVVGGTPNPTGRPPTPLPGGQLPKPGQVAPPPGPMPPPIQKPSGVLESDEDYLAGIPWDRVQPQPGQYEMVEYAHNPVGTSWQEANNYLGNRDERRIAANKRIWRDPQTNDISIRLHGTDVVTFHPNGGTTIRTGGYRTRTTAQTIQDYTGLRTSFARGGFRIGGEEVDGDQHYIPGPNETQGPASDEEAFHQVIHQNPLDATNHLVFADWLDEHDRPKDADFQRRVGRLKESGSLRQYEYGNLGSDPHPGYGWRIHIADLVPAMAKSPRALQSLVRDSYRVPSDTRHGEEELVWHSHPEMMEALENSYDWESAANFQPEQPQEPEPDEQAARYACYDDLDYHDLGPGGYPADVPHTPADDLALAIHNVSDALQAVCCMNYDDGGDSGADADSGEMGGPERDWWRNRGFAPYGRAPANDVGAIMETGWMGGGTSPSTPNYTPDLILADFLADHNDPREHLVRRDVSLRGVLDLSGKPSWSKFWENYRNHPAVLGHVRSGLESNDEILNHDFPDSSGTYVVRSLTDENGHTYHKHEWTTPTASYDAPFTPEESQNIINQLFPQQQEPEPEPEPEPEQFAAYDEGDPMDDPEPDPGSDDQPPWLRRYLDPERRRQQGMDASRRRQERLAAMSPESVLDQVHGVLAQHGELGRQHLRGHIRVPSDLLRQALELGQSQGTLTSRVHKPTGRGQVTEFWGLTNPPEQPPPDPMEQARQRLEELTRRGLAGQFDYPFSEIQELENTLGEDEADRIRQRVSADVMGGAGKRKRRRQQFAAYSEADSNTVKSLLNQLARSQQEWAPGSTLRLVTADALEENGNEVSAEQLRSDLPITGYVHQHGQNIYVQAPTWGGLSHFQLGTHPDVIHAISKMMGDRGHYHIHYGETTGPDAGRDWLEEWGTRGRIGRTGGRIKQPLVVATRDDDPDADEVGGDPILGHRIIRIRDLDTGEELYRHPNYHHGKVAFDLSGHRDYPYGVFVEGKNHANFRSPEERSEWADRMGLEVENSMDDYAAYDEGQRFAAYAMGIPDDEQFRVAMNSDPTDATIHGAYADWLDENNRPEDADFERSMMDMKQKRQIRLTQDNQGNINGAAVKVNNLPHYAVRIFNRAYYPPSGAHDIGGYLIHGDDGWYHIHWPSHEDAYNSLRHAYDEHLDQQNEPEQFMAYAEDDFPAMPGSGLAGNEWSGEIDPAAVTPDEYYHTENAASWNRWDSEGQHLPQSMHIESGVFHPPGYESPIPVYHWVHEDEDDNAVNEGDWTHELEHALNGAADFATENDEEPPEPDDSDIPSDISGNDWGSRDEIASYHYEGSYRIVRLEEGEFEFGGETYTAYRWTTRHDSDGDWTLDRRDAVRGGESYASEMHEEPEEEEEEEEDESGLIHDYPYKPDWEPLGDNPPFQGVELETQLKNTSKLTLDNAANRTLNILNQGYGFEEFAFLKEDSSIESGSPHTGKGTFEIVTHPATLAVHREQWMPFFQNIPQGLISHDARAGLHVHVGREGLSDLMVGKMLHFINNPNNKDFLVELARREVPRWAGFDPNVKAWDVNKSRRRYTALNVGKETIEFRLFRGTFKPESFFAALEFVDALVNLSRPAQSSVSDMESPNALLWYVTNNAKEYPNLMQFVERYLEQPVGQPGQVHMARYQNQIAHYPIPLSVSVRFWMDV